MPPSHELSPCPFCSSPARLYDYDTETDTWPVACDSRLCGATVESKDSAEAAIAAWNKRPREQQLDIRVADYQRELAQMQRWINDLQSGMWINCVYCGHRYGPGETTPVSMANALKAHIEQCPKHPMSALKAELERTQAQLAACQQAATALAMLTDDNIDPALKPLPAEIALSISALVNLGECTREFVTHGRVVRTWLEQRQA